MPQAPLVEDDYDLTSLLRKYEKYGSDNLPFRILQQAMDQAQDGKVHIERLLTRLEEPLPYDADEASFQLQDLRRDVRDLFRQRVEDATIHGTTYTEELNRFARYVVAEKCHCVTFNNDEVLDRALFKATHAPEDEMRRMFTVRPHWHPLGGYGLYFRSADSILDKGPWINYRTTSMLLLKLHGSFNWRIKLGFERPYAIDAVVHYSPWSRPPNLQRPINDSDESEIQLHLSNEVLVVPPVLTKSALQEPLLRRIWHLAFSVLRDAERVIFIGYSLRETDIAARFLFREALRDKNPSVDVINLAPTESARQTIECTYRTIQPPRIEIAFDFRDAPRLGKGVATLGTSVTPPAWGVASLILCGLNSQP